MIRVLTMAALAALLPLAACGGGGGGSGPAPDPSSSDIRELIGMAAPAEKAAQQNARADGITDRTTFLQLSPLYGNSTHPDLPAYDTQTRSCGWIEGYGHYCEALVSDEVADIIALTSLEVQISDIGFQTIEGGPGFEITRNDAEAVGTSNGITLVKSVVEAKVEEGVTDGTSYGAWMEHGAFGVLTIGIPDEGIFLSGRYAIAGGARNNDAPTVDATWRGVMVGTPATGAHRGDLLQGDATLRYDQTSLDATFANIKNLDRLAAHSVETVRFEDIPFYENGTYWTGVEHDFIWGAFYGPDQAETAGIFEQSNIVGAFGAKRQ